MTDPCVSVITPVYNSASVVERVVRSVAEQTLTNVEHILIDDGSRDDTLAVLATLKTQFNHLRIVEQTRRGAAFARNRGIEMARGRYIAFLDSDDEWESDKLAKQISFMEETDTLFSYGGYVRCRDGSKEPTKSVTMPDELRYADFLRGCPIGCLTVAYNQEVLGKRYMPEVRRGHDWGLWLALSRDGTPARRYPGVCATYHVRSGSLSGKKLRKAVDVYSIYRCEERFGRLRSVLYLVQHALSKLP